MSTIDYYDQNAQEYYERTVDADLAEIREYFLGFLRRDARILDFGCGSGRDAKAFAESAEDAGLPAPRLLLRRAGQSRRWTARRSFAGSHRNIWEWMSVI